MKFIIAGPCVIQNEKDTLQLADSIKQIGKNLNIEMIFKASIKKANRSSIKSYQGTGWEMGLDILKKVEKEIGLRTTTDIHETYHAKLVAGVCGILQIPAFLCRQTELLLAAAKTGKPVNVKKGQWMAPGDVKFIVEKLVIGGCKDFMITERGTMFGYGGLINDFGGFPEIRKYAPLCYDASHSTQRMGGGEISGGNRELSEPLARAAVAVGVDALFFEVLEDPDKSPSDSASITKLDKFEPMLKRLLLVDSLVPKLIL